MTQSASGSWYTMIDLIAEMRAQVDWERHRLPIACPNDGEPLQHGPNGELHCRFDGWTYDG